MELSEKIQKLRKEQGLTQEQFAEKLFVSRTAVSKWETGRGIPSMESLKQIAKLFHITLDQLLSTEEIVGIAESENKENMNRFASDMDGIINIAALLGLLLPLYKVEENALYQCVPLYQLGGWQGVVCWIAPVIMVICGIAQMVLAGSENKKINTAVSTVGYTAHVSAIILLILCGHPYPAVLFFFLFAMKATLLLKKRR
jgi:transcriptional regulator with XRE-family HTH domain